MRPADCQAGVDKKALSISARGSKDDNQILKYFLVPRPIQVTCLRTTATHHGGPEPPHSLSRFHAERKRNRAPISSRATNARPNHEIGTKFSGRLARTCRDEFTRSMSADLSQTPMAQRVAHNVTHHGVTIEDPYAWLRDPSYPQVND